MNYLKKTSNARKLVSSIILSTELRIHPSSGIIVFTHHQLTKFCYKADINTIIGFFFSGKHILSMEKTIFNEDELEDSWNAHKFQSKVRLKTGLAYYSIY